MKKLFSIVAVLFLLALPAAHASDVNGRIKGTVVDPSGAAVPNATVTATSIATGVSFNVQSGKDGSYLFAQLPIGTYSISATAPGFKTFKATGIVLNIDQEYVEQVKFSSGATSEVISIEADPVQVNTTDMQINNIVEAAQITELPNIARSFTLFETVEPGVQASSDRFGAYSADGSQTQQSSYLINGADTNDLPLNTVSFSPSPDAVQEFNLVTGPLNAEYDRNSGGIVNATLKQGTNKFHGDVFEFYRDTFLNTGNFFQNVAATSTTPQHKQVPPYHQNIFGGTIGGPILKDKLFFFFSYQGIHQRVPGSGGNTTVFSPAQLGGDFSGDLAAGGSNLGYSLSPTSTTPVPGTLQAKLGCTTWGQCITNNGGKFPTADFNPLAVSLLKYVPAANQGTNSYVFPSTAATKINQYIGRVDYSFNPRNQITAIYINSISNATSTIPFTGASLPGFGEIDKTSVSQYTADYVHQLSSTAVNDLAAHYTRFNYKAVTPQNVLAPSSLGFAINPENVAAESFPLISTGYFTLGFSTNGPQPRIDSTYQLDDNFSKTLGRHQLKFGYDGRRFNVSNPFSAENNGAYSFSTGTAFGSGDPGLDFLLGNSSGYGQGTGATIQAYAFLNYMYAQDTWKVTNAFTLSYGLGYQIDTPLHNVQYGGEAINCFIPGEQSTVFPNAPKGLVYPGDAGCTNTAQSSTRYKDFGPRIGFAYAPNLGFLSGGDAKKLSIRGGFGIYYNRTEEETSLNNLEAPPFGISSQGAVDYGAQAPAFGNPYQDIDSGTVYANKFPYTFPVKGQTIDYSIFEPLGLNTYAKGFRSPYAENFQVTVERELPSKTILRMSYVGSLAHHNQITVEGNPITQAGHDACLADTTYCGSVKTSGYRNLQDYYFSSHTQYGYVDPATGIPAFPTVGVITSEGSSNYNSAQVGINKAVSHGLEFQVSYTYSHALDNGSGYENSGYGGTTRGYNQISPSLNYGNSTYDARQRLVIAPIYVVPLLHGHNPLSPLNLALAGWQVSGVTTLATGFPYDISYGGGSANSLWCSASFTFYACPDEPNQTGPLVRGNDRTFVPGTARTTWFVAKSSGLSQAPLGTFGNESRNRYHGPGLNFTNMILAKNFNVTRDGSIRIQIRMESDNVFNHTNFSNPGSTPGTTTTGETATTPGTLSFGSTGQIGSVSVAARQTQLAAKIYF
jgi:hypothetical protein